LGATSAQKIERIVRDREACDFYHDIDLPEGPAKGQWDLRASADQYLGDVDFEGKRVLEIGPASGFLSFHMERRGAHVICIEPPMHAFWDLVQRVDTDLNLAKQNFGRHIERVRNSFWYCHAAFNSKVELYEANAYDLPETLGQFDIGVLAAVLAHCACPVRMVEQVAQRCQKIVVTELYIHDLAGKPDCRLVPSGDAKGLDVWWLYSPQFFTNYLEALGFASLNVTRHFQHYRVIEQQVEFFTVVAEK
jgi:SAM-dependent methyltransferase